MTELKGENSNIDEQVRERAMGMMKGHEHSFNATASVHSQLAASEKSLADMRGEVKALEEQVNKKRATYEEAR